MRGWVYSLQAACSGRFWRLAGRHTACQAHGMPGQARHRPTGPGAAHLGGANVERGCCVDDVGSALHDAQVLGQPHQLHRVPALQGRQGQQLRGTHLPWHSHACMHVRAKATYSVKLRLTSTTTTAACSKDSSSSCTLCSHELYVTDE